MAIPCVRTNGWLLADDFIHGLVLRPGQSGRTWRWHDPEFTDGPSDYRHAVRFASQELARRFHEEWTGKGALFSCSS